MIIALEKFGATLISRQAGKEALAAFRPTLRTAADEPLLIDFTGVITFSPSWGDEFLTPLLNEYGRRLALKMTDNPSVMATLEILEQANGKPFPRI